jgi:hypothetical protein
MGISMTTKTIQEIRATVDEEEKQVDEAIKPIDYESYDLKPFSKNRQLVYNKILGKLNSERRPHITGTGKKHDAERARLATLNYVEYDEGAAIAVFCCAVHGIMDVNKHGLGSGSKFLQSALEYGDEHKDQKLYEDQLHALDLAITRLQVATDIAGANSNSSIEEDVSKN